MVEKYEKFVCKEIVTLDIDNEDFMGCLTYECNA